MTKQILITGNLERLAQDIMEKTRMSGHLARETVYYLNIIGALDNDFLEKLYNPKYKFWKKVGEVE